MIVYRLGSKTDRNLTPRPGKDTVSAGGKRPGLSVATVHPQGGVKAQKIDTDKLVEPLRFFPDDTGEGATADHGTIAPADESGSVDMDTLIEWASSRSTAQHRLTRTVLEAIVEADVRSTQ